MAKSFGKRINEAELASLFEAPEGEMNLYYGRIGQGKTYGACADVIEDLRRGKVVYVNFPINYDGFDQRESFLFILGSLMFPWRNRLYRFPPENLRYIEIDDKFFDEFDKTNDCVWYLDEGHLVFDSYEMAKMSLKKRIAVLHTRHFNRTINIISQRPTAIHVTLRANVNRFYKFEKYFGGTWAMFFVRTEYQDLSQESVNEDKPIGRRFYFPKKRIYQAYNTKYLRGDLESSQQVNVEGYKIWYIVRIYLLLRVPFLRKRKRGMPGVRGLSPHAQAPVSSSYSTLNANLENEDETEAGGKTERQVPVLTETSESFL